MSSRPVSLVRRLSVTVALGTAAALLVGCSDADSADSPSPTSESAPSSAEVEAGSGDSVKQGEATVTVGERHFVFSLEMCAISDEDLLVAGPGMESGTGQTAHLSGDLMSDGAQGWTGEFRVDVGTTDKFESSDDFVMITNFSDSLSYASNGERHDFGAPARDSAGADLGHGEVFVRCE